MVWRLNSPPFSSMLWMVAVSSIFLGLMRVSDARSRWASSR